MDKRRTSPDVDQLIQQAFEQNREILAAQQRVAEARGLLRQAGVRPAPTVESNAASGRPLGTKGEEEFTVGYFQPIETGGKRPKRVLVAGKGLDLAEAELAERKRQLAYDIKTRYIDAVAAKEKVEAIDRIVGINRESYRLVEARVQRDDAAPIERQLLLVELNRTQAQRALQRARRSRLNSSCRRTHAINASGPVMALTNAAPHCPPWRHRWKRFACRRLRRARICGLCVRSLRRRTPKSNLQRH